MTNDANILFLGDVFLPAPVRVALPDDSPYIVNLEAPITLTELGAPGKVNLKTSANHLVASFGRAPLAACIANNHIMDYGEEGLRDTLAELDRAGIPHFGTVSSTAAGPPRLELVHADTRVALLGYVCETTSPVFATLTSAGVVPIDEARILEDVGVCRSRGADRVIVCLHWGSQEMYLPRRTDVEIARRLLDGDVDFVVGSHAHCTQAVMEHAGKKCFFGLGNAILPDLDVPSLYDPATGLPTERYRLTNRLWQRRGLAARYDVRSGETRAFSLKFDGTLLRGRALDWRKLSLGSVDRPGYDERFRRIYIVRRLILRALNFLGEPRLPSWRHFRNLFSLFRDRQFK